MPMRLPGLLSPRWTRKKMSPQKGEAWLVDLGMTEKARPALILSGPCGSNEPVLVTVIPHVRSCAGRN